ncbi:hypothetical protein MAUB1S_11898 [Mycolicibacterium aubagnense]
MRRILANMMLHNGFRTSFVLVFGIVGNVTRRYAVMVDFDGLLIDMSSYEHELDDPQPRKWRRFLAHTPTAPPMATGITLLEQLAGLGWPYSVSTTRPGWALDGVQNWLAHHAPEAPQATYARLSPTVDPVTCKRTHYFSARYHRDSPAICTLFVDDELPVVHELAAATVPAMHISEFATLTERDILTMLRRSRRALYGQATDSPAANLIGMRR